MKHFFLLGCLLLLFNGCGLRQREEALQKKETALNQKEQELLLREQTLTLKEEELNLQRLAADSLRLADSTAMTDTAATVNPALAGVWEVQMTCSETTCPGSAVGDTKTETWEMAYQDNDVVVRATVNNKLVRVYSGQLRGTVLELREAQQTQTTADARFFVRLQLQPKNRMDGQRVIERLADKCRIVYLLSLSKK